MGYRENVYKGPWSHDQITTTPINGQKTVNLGHLSIIKGATYREKMDKRMESKKRGTENLCN